MPSVYMERQKEIPMIFRRHGDTCPTNKNHILGGSKRPTGAYTQKLNIPNASESIIDKIGVQPMGTPFVPSFSAADKKVIRFYAFFLETVNESNYESYRVRKCVILYYLEDDTIQIIEPKIENSALPQGNFIKRHRIPLTDVDEKGDIQYYSYQALNVGNNIICYGRTFHIVDADAFTREWYNNNYGISLLPAENYPEDKYSVDREDHMNRETGKNIDGNFKKKQYEMKEFMEASLGKFSRPSDHLRRFLEHDRQVLRWYAMWDDTSRLYGMKHSYTIHYFLADNTVEIREEYDRNSGCDPFPKLLNRTRLVKNPNLRGPHATNDTMNVLKDEDYYSYEDFCIGKEITIYNRKLILLDVDANTRLFYKENGIDLPCGIEIKKEEKVIKRNIPPPHNGFGSEEDSLASCYSLCTKPPKDCLEKLVNKKVLRFAAVMDTLKPEDTGRQFIICIALSDNSISIMEPPVRNSGIIGGKFLDKKRRKNLNGEYFTANDFFVGARIPLGGQTFIILEMDEYSAKHMESEPEKFPKSNKEIILQNLRPYLNELNNKAEEFIGQEKEVSAAEISKIFSQIVPEFTEHEVITLIRFFNMNVKEKINISTLVDAINTIA